MKQQREKDKKQLLKERTKNVKEAREEMIKQARGKVMNYARKASQEQDVQYEDIDDNSFNTVVSQDVMGAHEPADGRNPFGAAASSKRPFLN